MWNEDCHTGNLIQRMMRFSVRATLNIHVSSESRSSEATSDLYLHGGPFRLES